MHSLLKILVFALACAGLAGCKKEDSNPEVPARKGILLSHQWRVNALYQNGASSQAYGCVEDDILTFQEDDSCSYDNGKIICSGVMLSGPKVVPIVYAFTCPEDSNILILQQPHWPAVVYTTPQFSADTIVLRRRVIIIDTVTQDLQLVRY